MGLPFHICYLIYFVCPHVISFTAHNHYILQNIVKCAEEETGTGSDHDSHSLAIRGGGFRVTGNAPSYPSPEAHPWAPLTSQWTGICFFILPHWAKKDLRTVVCSLWGQMSNTFKNIWRKLFRQKPEVIIVKMKKVNRKVFYEQWVLLLYNISIFPVIGPVSFFQIIFSQNNSIIKPFLWWKTCKSFRLPPALSPAFLAQFCGPSYLASPLSPHFLPLSVPSFLADHSSCVPTNKQTCQDFSSCPSLCSRVSTSYFPHVFDHLEDMNEANEDTSFMKLIPQCAFSSLDFLSKLLQPWTLLYVSSVICRDACWPMIPETYNLVCFAILLMVSQVSLREWITWLVKKTYWLFICCPWHGSFHQVILTPGFFLKMPS